MTIQADLTPRPSPGGPINPRAVKPLVLGPPPLSTHNDLFHRTERKFEVAVALAHLLSKLEALCEDSLPDDVMDCMEVCREALNAYDTP